MEYGLKVFFLTSWLFIFIKNSIFWVAIWQIKEYRLDRLFDYFSTPEGKKTLFNKGYVLELFTLSVSLVITFIEPSLLLPIYLLFTFLELFLLARSLVKKTLIAPVWTFKARLLIVLTFLTGYFLALLGNFTLLFYLIILGILPFLVMLSVVIIYPFDYILKKRLINRAVLKIRQHPSIKIVGITGSYGKTSVKEIAFDLLKNNFKAIKTIKNQNSEIGVAQTILNSNFSDCQIFVAEMGAYKKGEIKKLCHIATPDIAVLTGIDQQHSALFGGLPNIVAAKSEILFNSKPNAWLILNYDNKNIRSINLPKSKQVLTYGLDFQEADLLATSIGFKNGQQHFIASYQGQSAEFTTNLLGQHNILNILAGIGICLSLGMELKNLAGPVSKIEQIDQTLRMEKKKNLFLLDDSYNANPSGVLSAIKALNNFTEDKTVILDDILELGADSVAIHEQVAEALVKGNFKKIILVGKNYANLIKNKLIALGINQSEILLEKDDFQDIILYLNVLHDTNAVILFEGRRSKNYLKML